MIQGCWDKCRRGLDRSFGGAGISGEIYMKRYEECQSCKLNDYRGEMVRVLYTNHCSHCAMRKISKYQKGLTRSQSMDDIKKASEITEMFCSS